MEYARSPSACLYIFVCRSQSQALRDCHKRSSNASVSWLRRGLLAFRRGWRKHFLMSCGDSESQRIWLKYPAIFYLLIFKLFFGILFERGSFEKRAQTAVARRTARLNRPIGPKRKRILYILVTNISAEKLVKKILRKEEKKRELKEKEIPPPRRR